MLLILTKVGIETTKRARNQEECALSKTKITEKVEHPSPHMN